MLQAWISDIAVAPETVTMEHPFGLNPAFCLLCIFLLPLVANSTLSVPRATQEWLWQQVPHHWISPSIPLHGLSSSTTQQLSGFPQKSWKSVFGLTLPLAGDREKLMLFHALNKINSSWGQVTGIAGAAAGLLLLLPVLTHRDFSCHKKAAQCVWVHGIPGCNYFTGVP